MKINCLAISGSDPTCGAGAQLDVQVLKLLNVQPFSIISSITSQTADKVLDIWPLPESVILSQIKAIISSYKIDACKIGMLNLDGVLAIQSLIKNKEFKFPIVLDPILFSSSGFEFIKPDQIAKLFPFVSLVTPNIIEMEKFIDIKIDSLGDMEKALFSFTKKYNCQNVLLKGGHLNDFKGTDILIQSGKLTYFEGSDFKINSEIHGTGCFLSSAITAYLAHSNSLEESISKAKDLIIEYANKAILIGEDDNLIFNI